MLSLNAQQTSRLQRSRRTRFVEEVVDWLLEEFPLDGVNVTEARREVQAISEQAWSWGIESDQLVRLHVFCCRVLGEDYWQVVPDIERVMSSSELGDEVKLAWLSGYVDALHSADPHAVE